MKFTATRIPEVLLVEPEVHRDDRGFFLETYHRERFESAGISEPFVQDNHSSSRRGTLRGLHAQLEHPQGKLVRVVRGEIYDVAVDIRRGSPTFAQHVAVRLSSENFYELYIPPGFAHGFQTLSEKAEVVYKCTDLYRPDDQIGVHWSDPQIGIAWPLADSIVSEKDRGAPFLDGVAHLLPTCDGSRS